MEKPQHLENFPESDKLVMVVYREDGKGVITETIGTCGCCNQSVSSCVIGKKMRESKWRDLVINNLNRACKQNKKCKRVYPDAAELDSLIRKTEEQSEEVDLFYTQSSLGMIVATTKCFKCGNETFSDVEYPGHQFGAKAFTMWCKLNHQCRESEECTRVDFNPKSVEYKIARVETDIKAVAPLFERLFKYEKLLSAQCPGITGIFLETMEKYISLCQKEGADFFNTGRSIHVLDVLFQAAYTAIASSELAKK